MLSAYIVTYMKHTHTHNVSTKIINKGGSKHSMALTNE
jgi:hypothetical protein